MLNIIRSEVGPFKTNFDFTTDCLNLRRVGRSIPFIFVTLGCSYFLIRNNLLKQIIRDLFKRHRNNRVDARIVDNVEDCVSAVAELRKSCHNVLVLGMDCEWLSDGKALHKVALLQLASINGSCSLFRLCNMRHIPNCLTDLLSDDTVVKTGVAVTNDARKLFVDYGVDCKSCIDVRYMAKEVGLTAVGLGKMSDLYLGVELDKGWRIRCSNWEADVLTDKQIQYAAKDALMSVYLFEYFNNRYINRTYPWWKRIFWTDMYYWKKTEEFWKKYFDIGFSEKSFSFYQQKGNEKDSNIFKHIGDINSIKKKVSMSQSKDSFRQYSTRQDIARRSPLYHNIFIQAPDGMVLCTCDNKKAEWYVNKGIGYVVCEDPLTVRLKFEPSGRKGGGEGYYARVKNNICVVCGSTKSMRRKNIVPHEYRKYFPVEVKEHSSHDVLLFCDYCHFKSQFHDQKLREILAQQCDAPLTTGSCKKIELPDLRKMKLAARALYYNADKLPESRKTELEKIVLDYLKNNENLKNIGFDDFTNIEKMDNDLLDRIIEIETSVANENYNPHGKKVVEHYSRELEGGIHVLEQLWRNHFINNMAPQHLPDLWSVNYVHTNLE